MGKNSVKIHSGGASVKVVQPPVAKGGVNSGNIGQKGPVRGSMEGAGGAGWSHLPGVNYLKNNTGNKPHSPKTQQRSGEGGPHWDHLPSHPDLKP